MKLIEKFAQLVNECSSPESSFLKEAEKLLNDEDLVLFAIALQEASESLKIATALLNDKEGLKEQDLDEFAILDAVKKILERSIVK